MNEHFFAAIMAGGGGTRLWPLSRRSHPKQSLSLFDDQTLFQIAVDRIRPLIPNERIYVMTGADQVELLSEQCPEIPRENYLIEPEPRGTAAAIGYAAVHIHSHDPDGVMACLTADHYIRDESKFRETVQSALNGAYDGGLFTLGIQPTGPDPSYGYIQVGKLSNENDDHPIYRVHSFKEKPDAELAGKYLQSGNYLWNSGMFFWRADVILNEMKRQLPALRNGLSKIQTVLGKQNHAEVVIQEWRHFESTTIDYGVMEGAEEVYVLPAADLGWVDVGDWGRLFEILASDPGQVIASGSDMVFDSIGSMIVRSENTPPDKLIALLGVEDLIVVETDDVLLICNRHAAPQVKSIVEKLNSAGMQQYL